MSASQEFSEISVLIPGYSIEDLPTDLPEEDAASLLNAIACAWHPCLLQHSNSIPIFRQAESLTRYGPVHEIPHAIREASTIQTTPEQKRCGVRHIL